jgi:hypothetical protein
LVYENFDIDQAKEMIKKDEETSIVFIEEHGIFEDSIEETAQKATGACVENGTVYLYLKGKACTDRMRRNIVNFLMCVHKIVIFGDRENWPLTDPKIQFVNPEGIFAENHQRFFIFQSAAFNVALVARHAYKDNQEVVEAAMTREPEAVSLLGQTIGTRMYNQNN